MLGYDRDHQAYKLFDTVTQKAFISSNVKFCEDTTYFGKSTDTKDATVTSYDGFGGSPGGIIGSSGSGIVGGISAVTAERPSLDDDSDSNSENDSDDEMTKHPELEHHSNSDTAMENDAPDESNYYSSLTPAAQEGNEWKLVGRSSNKHPASTSASVTSSPPLNPYNTLADLADQEALADHVYERDPLLLLTDPAPERERRKGKQLKKRRVTSFVPNGTELEAVGPSVPIVEEPESSDEKEGSESETRRITN
jgi:hypothetical protein